MRKSFLIAGIALASSAVVASALVLSRRPAEPPEPPEPPPAEVDAASTPPQIVDAAPERIALPIDDSMPETLEAQRERLFRIIEQVHAPAPAAVAKLREIFTASSLIGQGNPKATRHPMTRAECRERRARADVPPGDPRCGAPHMVPLYDRAAGQKPESAKVCIDQYEFPNVPCEYPVVYAKASEVQEICQALGKRICDAHEWEGACAGSLRPADEEYHWGKPRILQSHLHNQAREKVWSYGPEKDQAKCATASRKSRECTAGGWRECGSNTYPAGAFVECTSPFGVFDLHGNAAEHMNLALEPAELASRGGTGVTEMKGSWFIFLREQAHEDDCRWRAPAWHATKLTDPESHRNYHLGFRCCKDVE